MGWELTAALSGAHTLGSATLENSGYNGFWSDAESAGVFNNEYFRSMMFKGWYQEKAVNGDATKNQFKRVDQGKDNTHKEMMLTTDLCLAYNANPALAESECEGECSEFDDTGIPLKAQNHDCCAWVDPWFSYDANNEIHDRKERFDYCGTKWAPRMFR
jgi:hypothetical protein